MQETWVRSLGQEDPLRSPGEGNSYPLQYYCLENSVDRGAWQATVHRVIKSQTWLNVTNTQAFLYIAFPILYFLAYTHFIYIFSVFLRKCFNWSIVDLQYHVSFGCTTQWYSYICIIFFRFFSLIGYSKIKHICIFIFILNLLHFLALRHWSILQSLTICFGKISFSQLGVTPVYKNHNGTPDRETTGASRSLQPEGNSIFIAEQGVNWFCNAFTRPTWICESQNEVTIQRRTCSLWDIQNAGWLFS